MTASWPPSFEAFEAFATLATFSNGREPRHREFMAGVHVGVLEFELSGAGACRSPVWCRYGDGGVVICLPVTEPRDERMTELAPQAEQELAEVIAETRREIELYRRHGDSYGYVFYLLRRRR